MHKFIYIKLYNIHYKKRKRNPLKISKNKIINNNKKKQNKNQM